MLNKCVTFSSFVNLELEWTSVNFSGLIRRLSLSFLLSTTSGEKKKKKLSWVLIFPWLFIFSDVGQFRISWALLLVVRDDWEVWFSFRRVDFTVLTQPAATLASTS